MGAAGTRWTGHRGFWTVRGIAIRARAPSFKKGEQPVERDHCAHCNRLLTSEEIAFWNVEHRQESRPLCFPCNRSDQEAESLSLEDAESGAAMERLYDCWAEMQYGSE